MIVKTTGTWAGKSDDTPIDFAAFPPDGTGLTEIWCIPGEGSSIEMYATEAETQMDKFPMPYSRIGRLFELLRQLPHLLIAYMLLLLTITN